MFDIFDLNRAHFYNFDYLIFSLDTYMSHEGVIYCKPHHKELFMPKTVRSDIIDVQNVTKQQEAVLKHQEAQRNHETIIR